MPSQRHEVLVDLFRQAPELLYALLSRVMPEPPTLPANLGSLKPSESVFSELRPPEYRADLVFEPLDQPAIILEVQLRDDEQKRVSWPAYVAHVGMRHRHGVILVVLTPSLATAQWAAQPIETGHPGYTLTPVVIGPDQIPRLTDLHDAMRSPVLAVLSAAAHGRSRKSEDVGRVALQATRALDEEQGRFYADFVLSQLSKHALNILRREVMENPHKLGPYSQIIFDKGVEEGIEQGIERGVEQGIKQALRSVLSTRGFQAPSAILQRIEQCDDPEQLQAWLVRAIDAEQLDGIFFPEH
ncbi:MAG: hypothetical protein AAFV53_29695 [Myxococcota bacterium]